MTMTDTEAKALALVNAAAQDRHYPIWPSFERSNGSVHEALCRAIEREAATEARHAAELREQAERFSEAVERVLTVTDRRQETHAWRTLSPFILPAPDPLVEEEDPIDALVDLLAPVLTHSQGMAARERESRFRNAIAALKARGV